MAYEVLARKYRPKTFQDVAGQDQISAILSNAILEKRIGSAYLFSGPRGSGKTTMARIFAKALNCLKPELKPCGKCENCLKEGKKQKDKCLRPIVTPCGKCDNCKEIENGSCLDIIEMDAASNRGIEEIKALIEDTAFVPVKLPYKVYIIDEAHQISKDAFNAFLKTLEEPPDKVVFILATTEPHKFPSTIRSRCQLYRFRLLSSQESEGVMKKIAAADHFEISDEALELIITAADGSMRDALSLLEQAVSASNDGKITQKHIRDLLGFLPRETIGAIVEYIAAGNLQGILQTVASIYMEGYDMMQFARDLREHLRKLMIYSVDPSILTISQPEKDQLHKQKDLFAPARHVRMSNLISKAIQEIRYNDQPRLTLEMYLLKMAENYYDVNALLRRIGELEKEVESGDPISKPPVLTHSNPKTHTYINSIKPPEAKGGLLSFWDSVIEKISSQHMTASELSKLRAEQLSETEIALYAPNDYFKSFGDKFKDKVAAQFKEKTGKDINVKVLLAPQDVQNQIAPPPVEIDDYDGKEEKATIVDIPPEDEGTHSLPAGDDGVPESVKKKAAGWGGKIRKVKDD
ncbi:MAG: DNA polymerase III subunit gamma/tau [Elusimicrobiota bacterium]|jgi:DNA polymerase-3 subunit gamma/tau|nr:DNA polymerase III subunit gamma/tau [Elusimicrobiota bacterium]